MQKREKQASTKWVATTGKDKKGTNKKKKGTKDKIRQMEVTQRIRLTCLRSWMPTFMQRFKN